MRENMRSISTLGVLLVCLLTAGCVRRLVTVRSEPSAAMLYVDGKKMGPTPVTFKFHHYGTRRFTLIQQEPETGRIAYRKTVSQRIRPPWYQVFPLDFVFDVLLPFRFEDEHEFTYALEKPVSPDKSELLERANELRGRAYMPSPE